MSKDFQQGPNVFHPEKAGAVGSRNSLAQEGRDKYVESKALIDEEVDKILNHVSQKLPPEVLERLEVMGGIKEKLHNYVNQNYVNMFNRYMVTIEDELQKKVRDFVDKEEYRTLARYTPREITELLDKIGGMDKFNTSEVEKSIVNMYGHLQGHVQREVTELENQTNALLRQKTDVGALLRGENAYSVVKCAFKDNSKKPKTVSDIKLSVNILDSELVSPIFHYQVTTDYLIKDVISKHITDLIDVEIEELKDKHVDEGKSELTDTELLFEKINRIENYTDDEVENEQSKRYAYIAKHLMDKINGLPSEIPVAEYDSLNIRENIKKVIDTENIRNRGFNTAVNSLTSILDNSKLGYQYIENMKNARVVVVKEYEDVDEDSLPDERYQMRLSYLDQEQLELEQRAYDKQMEEFDKEIDKVWETLETIYETKFKEYKKIYDFHDLARKFSKSIVKYKKRQNPDYEAEEGNHKLWDEVTFIKPEDSEVDRTNRTYTHEKAYLKNKLILMKEKLQEMYGHSNPPERVVTDERVDFLIDRFDSFSYKINPYHVQPGLLLDMDLTSIKKKKTTIMGMSNVLNEFLHRVSKGFQDAAFASFSRRRSTIREDIDKTFETLDEKKMGESHRVNQRDLSQMADLVTKKGPSDDDYDNGGNSVEFQEL